MPLSTAVVGDFFARERITVSTVVKTLTVPSHAVSLLKANYALMTIETAAIRWTVDGTDPAATSVGHLSAAGSIIELRGQDNVASFKAIRDTAVDGVIEVSYARLKGVN